MGAHAKALPMDVRFRDVDRSTGWIWLRFADNPGQGEQGYVTRCFESPLFFLASWGPSTLKTCRCTEGR